MRRNSSGDADTIAKPGRSAPNVHTLACGAGLTRVERVVERDRIRRAARGEPPRDVHLVALARAQQLEHVRARGRVVDAVEARRPRVERAARRGLGDRVAAARTAASSSVRGRRGRRSSSSVAVVVDRRAACRTARTRRRAGAGRRRRAWSHPLDRPAEVVRAEADPESARVDLAQHVEGLLAARRPHGVGCARRRRWWSRRARSRRRDAAGRWRRMEAGRIRGARTRATVVDAGTVGPWTSS